MLVEIGKLMFAHTYAVRFQTKFSAYQIDCPQDEEANLNDGELNDGKLKPYTCELTEMQIKQLIQFLQAYLKTTERNIKDE